MKVVQFSETAKERCWIGKSCVANSALQMWDCLCRGKKKLGDSNALRESTLALALVIQDYRPFMIQV